MKVHIFSVILLYIFVATAEAAPQELRVGIVPQFNSDQIYKIWRPVLDKLEERTGYKFKMIGFNAIKKFEQEFMHGDFDLAYMNPYFVLLGAKAQLYEASIRDHSQDLYGILVVKKDFPESNGDKLENTLKHLHGSQIAFPSANALGASMLIRSALHEKFGIEFEPKYVGSHSSVYMNVMLGVSKAGGGVQKTFEEQTDEVRNSLRVIYRTPSFPSHPVLINSKLSAEVKAKLHSALLSLDDTDEGRELLLKIPIKKLGPASNSEYMDLDKFNLEKYYATE